MSICCSPPEIRPALRPSNGSSSGKSAIASSTPTPPRRRLSATDKERTADRSSGTSAVPRAGPTVQWLVDPLAVPLHFAGEWLQLSGEGEERRALAGAVRAEDEQHLARSDLEVDVVDRGLVVVAGGEAPRGEQRRARRARDRDAGGRCDGLIAEVSLDDGAVSCDRVGVAVRDHPAEVEHRHLIAHTEHHRHVVLDEENGHAPLVGELAHEVRELGGLVLTESGGGFVEQQHRWLGRDGACERDEPALPERQLLGTAVEVLFETELADDRGGGRAERSLTRMHEVGEVRHPVALVGCRAQVLARPSCCRTARGSGTSGRLRQRRVCGQTRS